MKNFTFIFIITTGLVVPTLSHAGGTASGIGAGFERDLNRQPVITYAVRQEVDPIQHLINSTLRGSSNPAFASLHGVTTLD